MKLRDARLCADCDEVYKAKGLYARCPSCGSESFALISRWVPTLHEFEKWIDNRTHEVKAYKTKGGDAATSATLTLRKETRYEDYSKKDRVFG